MEADNVYYFPFCQAEGGNFTGFAVSNYSSSPAQVQFTPYSSGGSQAYSPSQFNLEPQHQLGKLSNELFGQPAGSRQSLWIEMTTDNPEVGGFSSLARPTRWTDRCRFRRPIRSSTSRGCFRGVLRIEVRRLRPGCRLRIRPLYRLGGEELQLPGWFDRVWRADSSIGEGTADVVGMSYQENGAINTTQLALTQYTQKLDVPLDNVISGKIVEAPYSRQEFFAFLALRYFRSTETLSVKVNLVELIPPEFSNDWLKFKELRNVRLFTSDCSESPDLNYSQASATGQVQLLNMGWCRSWDPSRLGQRNLSIEMTYTLYDTRDDWVGEYTIHIGSLYLQDQPMTCDATGYCTTP